MGNSKTVSESAHLATSPAKPGLPSWGLISDVLRHHAFLLTVIVLYLVAYYIEAGYLGLSGARQLSPASYFGTSAKLSFILIVLFVGILVLYRLARDRPERPIG